MFEGAEIIELGDFIIVSDHFIMFLFPAILLYAVVMITDNEESSILKFIIGMVIVILIVSGLILLLEFYFQDAYKEQKLEKLERLDNDTSLTKGCEECCFRIR